MSRFYRRFGGVPPSQKSKLVPGMIFMQHTDYSDKASLAHVLSKSSDNVGVR